MEACSTSCHTHHHATPLLTRQPSSRHTAHHAAPTLPHSHAHTHATRHTPHAPARHIPSNIPHHAAARHQASGVLDLSQTLPGLSRPTLLALLHFIYTGRVGGSAEGGGAGGDADVEHMAPQLALELLPPASALLLDELKSLCEGAPPPPPFLYDAANSLLTARSILSSPQQACSKQPERVAP